jgi:hypothetical protein
VEQRLHEAGTRAEEDLRNIINYINDEVVPDAEMYDLGPLEGGLAVFVPSSKPLTVSLCPETRSTQISSRVAAVLRHNTPGREN